MRDYAKYVLLQNGQKVASSEGAKERAYTDIMHYHMVYSQDAPCKVKRIM